MAFLITTPAFAVSLKKARAMAKRAGVDSEFPIVVNGPVLKQLNRYTGSPKWRRHMKVCLKRMKNYRHMISRKIDQHDVPAELIAVPLIESSFQNTGSKQSSATGLWMIIRSTARNQGLKVNRHVDQRLNVRLSTDAALRYLKSNHRRFNDWQLALLAYNMGENKVKRAIKKTGSRNAWTLIQKGHEGDKGYLAKVMAAVIIMKNPEVLN